ncbi:MAG: AEC family transporter [Oscillospiraceae bacterium]|nr:AEC family transporter [Oscillospiraceae bacterium]
MQIDNSQVVSQVAILFLTMLCGIYARKRGFVDEKGTKTLSKILVNITSPLLIIDSFQLDFDAEKLSDGLIILAASVIIHIAVTFLGMIFFKWEKTREKNKILRFTLIFGNCAFLGYPVLNAVFGDGIGVFYGAFYTLMFNVYIWTYGISMLQKGKENAVRPKPWNVIINAGTVASVIGVILFAAKIKLPAVLGGAVGLVGDMTFPLAMLIIGSLVSTLDFKEVLGNYRVYIFCLFKLIVLPLITLGVLKLIDAPLVITYMLVTMTAVPSATNSAIFAELYDCDARLAAQCVGISTVFSMITLPAMIWLTGIVI